jgi:hypothetical protein
VTPTHADVLAAIDAARPKYLASLPGWAGRVEAANAHCDDLRATAERHAPDESDDDRYMTPCRMDGDFWPCPDYRQVIDRLTTWGYL